MTGGIAAAYVLTGRLKEGVALLERTIDASDKEEVKVRAPFRRTYCAEISPRPMKSRCACEWGGWGRLSDDGPGHYNPDPSEGPWGGGVMTSTAMVPLRQLGHEAKAASSGRTPVGGHSRR